MQFKLYLDRNANGLLDLATDLYLGQTVALLPRRKRGLRRLWRFTRRSTLNDPALRPRRPAPFS